MKLIGQGAVQRVTLHAQMSDGGPEWPAGLEAWPVQLGWGVTLEAPDLYFNASAPSTPPWLFQVSAFDAGDQGVVTIEGDPQLAGRYVHIGVPADETGRSSIPTAVASPGMNSVGQNFAAVPLVISNAWLHSTDTTLIASDGASIQIGPLPVHFGSNEWRKLLDYAPAAIGCNGDALDPPRIFDVGTSPLQIDDADAAIVSEGTYCDISLTHGPRIGSQPGPLFDGGCPPLENEGVLMIFNAHVSLGSVEQPAVMSCQQVTGVELTDPSFTTGQSSTRNGIPRLDFTGTFKNQRCFGVRATTGDIFLTATTFENSYGGVWALGTAYVSLDLPYPFEDFYVSQNDVNMCVQPPLTYGDCGIKNIEENIAAPPFALIGLDGPLVTADLDAAAWRHWDVTLRQPQIWRCIDRDYQDCSCAGADCPDSGSQPLPPGADVVFRYDAEALPDFDGGQLGQCH